MPDGCQRNAGRVGTQGSFAHRQQFVYLISIARTSSGSRADAGRASLLVSKHQPLDLAYRQVQTLSRQARLEHPVYDGLNHFESIEFTHVQCHQCSVAHGWLP